MSGCILRMFLGHWQELGLGREEGRGHGEKPVEEEAIDVLAELFAVVIPNLQIQHPRVMVQLEECILERKPCSDIARGYALWAYKTELPIHHTGASKHAMASENKCIRSWR